MKRVDGIQIGKRIFRYGPNVFQTETGALLKFTSDAEKWEGVFPGCSWDLFYDEVMPRLCGDDVNILAVKERRIVPIVIQGRDVGKCRRCSATTSFKFCSISCWFFETVEMTRDIIANADHVDKVDRNARFIERMYAMFGQQVDADLVQVGCDPESAS